MNSAHYSKRLEVKQNSSPLAYEDVALSDLSPETRTKMETLHQGSWYGTFQFCKNYSYPPIDRCAFLRHKAEGKITRSVFYNTKRWGRVFRELEIIGHPAGCIELLEELLRVRDPDLITFLFQPKQYVAETPAHLRLVGFRRMGEDYEIALPSSNADYLKQLGKTTRKHLPYYWRRIQREYATNCTVSCLRDVNIKETDFFQLLKLNHLRMLKKGRRSLWNLPLARHRWRLVQGKGLLVGISVGGKLVGGTVCILHDQQAFLILIAHDPVFDNLNMGNVSLWLTVEHLINCRYRALHLLWGGSFYKEQFGGSLKPIYRVTYAANSKAATAKRFSDWLKFYEAESLVRKVRHRIDAAIARFGFKNADFDIPAC
jgi:hypothetical protein